MDPSILFDESKPFVGDKLNLLETYVAFMNSGDPVKMPEACDVLENMRDNTNFWLQTDTIIKQSQSLQTVFFGLMALHLGIKVS